MIDLAILATTFILIFPAELPDKTFIATLVLATRFRHLWVWIGVIAAFAVQVLIAVVAGGLLALLPQRLVLGITFVLFVIGAVIMYRGGLAHRAREREAEADEESEVAAKAEAAHPTSAWKIVTMSFVILFTAEWGDLSQLLTAGMAARTHAPASVFIGSWLALATVSGLAVLAGTWLRSHIAIWRIRLVSGAVLTALAMWTAWEFLQA